MKWKKGDLLVCSRNSTMLVVKYIEHTSDDDFSGDVVYIKNCSDWSVGNRVTDFYDELFKKLTPLGAILCYNN